MSAMRSIGRLLRGSDREFFVLFEQTVANVVRAAELLTEMLAVFPDSAGLAREILICEQDGDQLTHEVVRRINQMVVTPIDREDILLLASALDDIVDFTEEIADMLGLYGIEAPMVQAQALAHVLLDATRELQAAVRLIRDFKDISRHTVEVHRLENEGDRIVRGAIA
jgi:predicted phosphate transport protein (TIGR00153 family)